MESRRIPQCFSSSDRLKSYIALGFSDTDRIIGLNIVSPHSHLAKKTAFICRGKAKNSILELGIQTEKPIVRGINTNCSNNIFRSNEMGSTSAIGVLLESTAKKNKFMLTQIDGGIQTQPGATGNVFYRERFIIVENCA